jgi:DNA repair exonuclease SbcCD ATPase subunit
MSRNKILTSFIIGLSLFLLFRFFAKKGDGTAPAGSDEAPAQAAYQRPGLPLDYAIGEVDPRFGITRERLSALAEEARKIWEEGAGRELLRYNEEASFKVNLVFDWRQEKLIAAKEAKAGLDENGRSFDMLQGDYNRKSSTLENSRNALDESARGYQDRLNQYNARVARWNESGERAETERSYLQSRKAELETEQADLGKKRTELNQQGEELNKLADQLNELAKKHNLEVENFNGAFVQSRDFEKGVFDGSAINIYEFEKEEDLKLTLIHEFGHALGMGHTENPASIMHRKLAVQDLNNIRLSAEDLAQLREKLKE